MTASGKQRYRALRQTPAARTAKPAKAAGRTGAAPLKPGEPGPVSAELTRRGILPKVPRGSKRKGK